MDDAKRDSKSGFARILGMSGAEAELFIRSGYSTIDEVAWVPIDEPLSGTSVPRTSLETWRRAARLRLLDGGSEDGEMASPLPFHQCLAPAFRRAGQALRICPLNRTSEMPKRQQRAGFVEDRDPRRSEIGARPAGRRDDWRQRPESPSRPVRSRSS